MWINRVNGKDGPVPQRCAKCKRFGWIDGQHVDRNPNPITDEERGLMMRLYKFEASKKPGYWTTPRAPDYVFHTTQYTPNELCKKFLSLKPRPRIDQLKYVLEPLGPEARKILKNYTNRSSSFKEYIKKNSPELHKTYEDALQLEIKRRREYMQKIIDYREQKGQGQGQGQGQES